jgi:hypothetical protein
LLLLCSFALDLFDILIILLSEVVISLGQLVLSNLD